MKKIVAIANHCQDGVKELILCHFELKQFEETVVTGFTGITNWNKTDIPDEEECIQILEEYCGKWYFTNRNIAVIQRKYLNRLLECSIVNIKRRMREEEKPYFTLHLQLAYDDTMVDEKILSEEHIVIKDVLITLRPDVSNVNLFYPEYPCCAKLTFPPITIGEDAIVKYIQVSTEVFEAHLVKAIIKNDAYILDALYPREALV